MTPQVTCTCTKCGWKFKSQSPIVFASGKETAWVRCTVCDEILIRGTCKAPQSRIERLAELRAINAELLEACTQEPTMDQLDQLKAQLEAVTKQRDKLRNEIMNWGWLVDYYNGQGKQKPTAHDLKEFRKACDDTSYNQLGRFTEHVAILFKPEPDPLIHASMGIAGEAGEIIDAVKRAKVYGGELDTANLLEEAGDVLFYVTALLHYSGHSLNDAIEHNIAKLRKRYPQGYSDKAAIERADKGGAS